MHSESDFESQSESELSLDVAIKLNLNYCNIWVWPWGARKSQGYCNSKVFLVAKIAVNLLIVIRALK